MFSPKAQNSIKILLCPPFNVKWKHQSNNRELLHFQKTISQFSFAVLFEMQHRATLQQEHNIRTDIVVQLKVHLAQTLHGSDCK